MFALFSLEELGATLKPILQRNDSAQCFACSACFTLLANASQSHASILVAFSAQFCVATPALAMTTLVQRVNLHREQKGPTKGAPPHFATQPCRKFYQKAQAEWKGIMLNAAVLPTSVTQPTISRQPLDPRRFLQHDVHLLLRRWWSN